MSNDLMEEPPQLISDYSKNMIFWISCVLVGIMSIIYITADISRAWSAESVYITLDASSLQITEVDFPGVAICDVNKISKQRAIQLANNLTKYTRNRNFGENLSLVQLLGNLYDYNIYGARNFPKLQDLLIVYDNVTTERDLILRLSSLITPCGDLLLNCSWNSVVYKCMDLFQTRLTDSGFCCVFNYIRVSPEAFIVADTNRNVPKDPKTFLGTGVTKGLSVTINNNISDYFYKSMATRGSLLKIFLPGDFPDLSSGSLRQIIVQERSEVFVNVDANTLLTYDQRKCIYSDEEKTVFGHYTSSNCFVSCKLNSIISLCNCIPFMLPIAEGIETDDISFCNLVDIPCLNRYQKEQKKIMENVDKGIYLFSSGQGKWLRYYPSEALKVKELNLDIGDSLVCDECMPNCNDVTYAIDTNYFEFFSEDILYRNSSRIHVYANKPYTNLYKKMVTVTWYESLSTFGGIVSMLLGISIINFVEIGVLVLKLLARKFRKK